MTNPTDQKFWQKLGPSIFKDKTFPDSDSTKQVLWLNLNHKIQGGK